MEQLAVDEQAARRWLGQSEEPPIAPGWDPRGVDEEPVVAWLVRAAQERGCSAARQTCGSNSTMPMIWTAARTAG
jgi:hypothetical protein